MKILHVGFIEPTLCATGPSHSVRGLLRAQAEIGLDVGLLCTFPLAPGQLTDEIPGVYLFKGPHRQQRNPWFVSRDWVTRIKAEFGEPDIVSLEGVYTPFECAFSRICMQQGWPYIVTPRGGLTHLAQKMKRTKKLIANFLFFRSYLKHATAIRALAASEAKQIQELFDVKSIITVPNGVEDYLLKAAEELSPADLSDFKREGDLVLGFVGRIDMFHKGLDLLLEAMAILKSQSREFGYKLFVVGPFRTKKDQQSFWSAIESFGLRDTVKWLGPKYREEKLCHILACDVFVHTSRFEGMPMAVLEAMALKRPCLVTPGTNVADLVRQGGGWECKPEPRSIAEAVNSIYEKRNSLESLGQQSFELIRAQFTWRNIARRLLEEYEKIMEQRGNPKCAFTVT